MSSSLNDNNIALTKIAKAIAEKRGESEVKIQTLGSKKVIQIFNKQSGELITERIIEINDDMAHDDNETTDFDFVLEEDAALDKTIEATCTTFSATSID